MNKEFVIELCTSRGIAIWITAGTVLLIRLMRREKEAKRVKSSAPEWNNLFCPFYSLLSQWSWKKDRLLIGVLFIGLGITLICGIPCITEKICHPATQATASGQNDG